MRDFIFCQLCLLVAFELQFIFIRCNCIATTRMPVMRSIPATTAGIHHHRHFPTVLNFSFVHLYEPTLFIPWRITVIDSAFFPFIYVSPTPSIHKLVIRLHRFALSASLLNAIMRVLKFCKNCPWMSHARYNKAIIGADVLRGYYADNFSIEYRSRWLRAKEEKLIWDKNIRWGLRRLVFMALYQYPRSTQSESPSSN